MPKKNHFLSEQHFTSFSLQPPQKLRHFRSRQLLSHKCFSSPQQNWQEQQRRTEKIMQAGLFAYPTALKYKLFLSKFRRDFSEICICVVYVDQWIHFWTQSLIPAVYIHLYANMHLSCTLLLLLLLLLLIIYCPLRRFLWAQAYFTKKPQQQQ